MTSRSIATCGEVTFEVFRTQDGRVFANVNRGGVQLAHLKAGESYTLPAPQSENSSINAAAQERPLDTNGGHDTGHIGPQSECVVARGEAPRVPASAAPYDILSVEGKR